MVDPSYAQIIIRGTSVKVPQPHSISIRHAVPYFRQLLDLVGIEVEFLQGLLEAKDLLRNGLQAAVGVVQRRHRLLLAPQAAARHQPNKQTPLGHPQALERENRGVSKESAHH